MKHIISLITNSNLVNRLVSLWILGIILNLFAWLIAYLLIPDAALKGIFPSSSFINEQSTFWETLTFILAYNILFACGLILIANLTRIGSFPLGYFLVFFHWSMYGIFLGSNSFDISKGNKIPPSFSHLISSVGFLEISAYTFIAAASINIYMYQQKTFLTFKVEKIRTIRQVRLAKYEYAVIALACAMIIIAGFRESLSILFGWD